MDVQDRWGGRILNVDEQGGGRVVLKIRQFLWTSYEYRPLGLVFTG